MRNEEESDFRCQITKICCFFIKIFKLTSGEHLNSSNKTRIAGKFLAKTAICNAVIPLLLRIEIDNVFFWANSRRTSTAVILKANKINVIN